MYRGYPKIEVVTNTAAEAAPVEVKSQEPTKRISAADAIKNKTSGANSAASIASGDAARIATAAAAAANPKDTSISSVEISLAALLKMGKHATENPRSDGTGHVTGVQRGGTVHITNTFRLKRRENARIPNEDDESIEKKKQENQELEQQENDAKRALRGEYVDTFVVGNYVLSSLGKHWFGGNIMKMMELTVHSAPGVLINFDRTRTLAGRPYVRAYVLTDEFILHAEKFMKPKPKGFKPTAEEQEEERLSLVAGKIFDSDEGIMREIPITIKTSIPQQMLLRDITPTPVIPSTSSAALTNQTEATFSSLISNLNYVLGKIDEEPSSNKSVSDGKMQKFFALQQAKEQAEHLESVCDSILMNIAVVRKV